MTDRPRVYLTDEQAATRFGWTARKVKHLRLTGRLPYFPGRPPLIEEADLEAYVASLNRPALSPPPE